MPFEPRKARSLSLPRSSTGKSTRFAIDHDHRCAQLVKAAVLDLVATLVEFHADDGRAEVGLRRSAQLVGGDDFDCVAALVTRRRSSA